jgi:hypothetical protein
MFCSCRNVCTKYSNPFLCGVSGPMRKAAIKTHAKSSVHWESHTISREAKVEQNAPIIHPFRNTRNGCVIVVVANMNS